MHNQIILVFSCSVLLVTESSSLPSICSTAMPVTGCEPNQFYDHLKQVCSVCRTCRPGFYVHCPCGQYDTECKNCQNGTYSVAGHCKPCTPCKEYEFIHKLCNSTSDTNCKGIIPDETGKSGNSHKIYHYIIVVLAGVVVVVLIIICFVCVKMRRNQDRTDDRNASVASEARFLDASSYSSVEDPRMRRFKNDDSSIQSSLLSTDCSGSEKLKPKLLRNPDFLIGNLPATVYENLGKLLNPGLLYKDWKTLAGKLHYTPRQIENFKINRDLDFTEKLLLSYVSRYTEATVGYLCKILTDMERLDAADVLFQYDSYDISGSQSGASRVETPV